MEGLKEAALVEIPHGQHRSDPFVLLEWKEINDGLSPGRTPGLGQLVDLDRFSRNRIQAVTLRPNDNKQAIVITRQIAAFVFHSDAKRTSQFTLPIIGPVVHIDAHDHVLARVLMATMIRAGFELNALNEHAAVDRQRSHILDVATGRETRTWFPVPENSQRAFDE